MGGIGAIHATNNKEHTHTMKPKVKNNYITLGTIAIVDISTKKYPNASMKIDLDVWLDLIDRGIGRCSDNGLGYAQTNFEGTVKQIHKLITPHFKMTVDHINHDRADNRMVNLRDVSYSSQSRNQSLSKRNKSGYSGITERKGVKGSTWRAYIGSNYGIKYLGSFKTLAKAVDTRKAAEVELGFHTLHGAK